MKISIIYAACNQGKLLQETVDSAIVGLSGCRDWEIIVVDDKSDDGCCEFLLVDRDKQKYPLDRIKLFQPEEKLGVSHARHFAAEQTTGDVIVTSDTHCEYPRRSLWRMAHWAARLRAIIVPPVNLLSLDRKRNHRTEGGGFEISPRGLRVVRPPRARTWPSMYGSIYLMRRDVWDFLGGWLRLPGYWGGEEQMVSTVAYLFGVPIKVLSGDALSHHTCTHKQYREKAKYPYPLPPHHQAEIAHYYHAACFPQTYAEIWGPMLVRTYNYDMPDVTRDGAAALATWIRERAVWDEHRFFKTVLGIDNIKEHVLIKHSLERMHESGKQIASSSDNEPGPVASVDGDNPEDVEEHVAAAG